MNKAPSFQWYPKDCDTDENVREMNDEEFGFYMRLLNHSWMNDGIPEDLVKLARIMSRPEKKVRRLWVQVSKCFEQHPEKIDRKINKKQFFQKKTIDEFKQRASEFGKKGAETKWKGHGVPHVNEMPTQCEKMASASPSPSPPPVYNTQASPGEMAAPPPNPKRALLSPEFERAIDRVGRIIQKRHPAVRSKGITEITDPLRAILRRFPNDKKLEVLDRINSNHESWCSTEEWTKDEGRYAKGLDNWLAPTKKRWDIQAPIITAAPTGRSAANLNPASIIPYDPFNLGGERP